MTIVSLVFAAYVSRHPVKTKLRITYIAVACTVVSGIFLIIQTPSALVSFGTSGAVYLAIIFLCTTYAQYKLAHTRRRVVTR